MTQLCRTASGFQRLVGSSTCWQACEPSTVEVTGIGPTVVTFSHINFTSPNPGISQRACNNTVHRTCMETTVNGPWLVQKDTQCLMRDNMLTPVTANSFGHWKLNWWRKPNSRQRHHCENHILYGSPTTTCWPVAWTLYGFRCASLPFASPWLAALYMFCFLYLYIFFLMCFSGAETGSGMPWSM